MGIVQTGNVIKSAIAEPKLPASIPYGAGIRQQHISISALPILKYPKGMGIWIKIVAIHISAAKTAVRQMFLVFDFIV